MKLRIRGMDCAEEVATLRSVLGPLVGGEDRLTFDLLEGRMKILPGGPPVNIREIQDVVARTGMQAEPWGEPAGPSSTASRLGGAEVRLMLGSGTFLLAGFLAHVWDTRSVFAALGADVTEVAHRLPVLVWGLYAVAAILGLVRVLPKAWAAVRRRRPDMNLLMTVAVLGAIGIGEWFEAATVSFLFSLSLALESWSVARARRAVAALLDLTPPVARMRCADGTEQDVPIADVVPGSVCLVNPGQRVPLDGEVLRGASQVNQAPITGESVPVLREPGDPVYAGTINGDGALEITVTKPAGDTMLARIIRLVEDARTRRAPAERWVERFSAVYTPAVMVLALAILVGPPMLPGQPWPVWTYRALTLLVIACPCALVISTPVGIVAALTAAARRGVLVKGGAYIELPAAIRAIALDKTGTLTAGRPVVVSAEALGGRDPADILRIAAALEVRSHHPLARAIARHAAELGIVTEPAEEVSAVPGRGAVGNIGGVQYWIGSHRYLEERRQEDAVLHRRLEALAVGGRSVAVVGTDTEVCGLIVLEDSVRAGAGGVIQGLHDAGVERVVILTGDARPAAEAVAAATGVDEVQADLLPEDKVAAVAALVDRYGVVAMIGDGINDAPALARASLGIAMGATGSDAAIETADIVLMSDDLSRLPWLIGHSRQMLRIIRQNIALALGVKALFIALTFLGHASLWAAIAADMGMSLLVIANALRLLKPRENL